MHFRTQVLRDCKANSQVWRAICKRFECRPCRSSKIRRDASGNENEVCVVIKPTAKDFENRITSKKTFTAFERLTAAKEYEISCEEKAEKEAKKEAEKAQKIAKSKT